MLRRLLVIAFVWLLPGTAASPALAQTFPNCAEWAEAELRSLPFDPDERIVSLRYERIINRGDQGSELLGVRAWVRLKSCSGYLVIDMTRSCFVRQSYTRGNCAVEGVTRY